MSYGKPGRGAKRYQSVGVASGVMDATPHRLVQMLLDGAVEKVSIAKGALERSDIPEKGKYIVWAVTIVEGLRASLDLERGGEIAANLDSLYEYVGRRLTEANLDNDPDILVEVADLLVEIRDAWDAMPDEVKVPPQSSTG
ncbi:MAG: flagellar export chaperone FliS [Gammaproteobacteria bacterium]|jgi:flagellar protein FliS